MHKIRQFKFKYNIYKRKGMQNCFWFLMLSNAAFWVCGGPAMGLCADITADAVDPCDNGSNTDSCCNVT